jgi:hypothetical protein
LHRHLASQERLKHRNKEASSSSWRMCPTDRGHVVDQNEQIRALHKMYYSRTIVQFHFFLIWREMWSAFRENSYRKSVERHHWNCEVYFLYYDSQP